MTEPATRQAPWRMPPLLNRETRDPRVQSPGPRAGAPRRRAAARAAALRLHRLFEPRRVLRGPLRRLPRGLAPPGSGVTAADIEALAAAAHALVDDTVRSLQRRGDAGARRQRHPHRQPRRPQRRASGAGSTASSRSQVRPLLVPVGLDPAHPFPQVANKSLNFIARLAGKDAFGRRNTIDDRQGAARAAARDQAAAATGADQSFVLLTSVIRAHLGELFPGPRGRGVLAVPHHPRLRPRGRRRRQQPAPGAALRA